jgi:hypothetical protein
MPHAGLTAPRLRDTLFEFVTGQSAPSKVLGDIAGMLRSVYGSSARNPERPNLKAASEDLGMSVRQLQRWARGETTPRSDNPRLRKLNQRVKSATTTKRGRRQALKAAKTARPANMPKIAVTGIQGKISSHDEQYRPRTTSTEMSEADYEAFQAMWAEHGPEGAVDWLHDHFDRNYLADWHFVQIDKITWTD